MEQQFFREGQTQMTIELPHLNLVQQLHSGIQDLKYCYPDRWKSMLEALANDPNVNIEQLAKRQAPAAPVARLTPAPAFTQEQLEGIVNRAIGVR
ncbi:hypothetical protein H6F89_28705 [Cyanobacteria bacterium FACHB-63]|nr:hypothetical protein [Cyanobacteria bacterium FACHB-63]